MKLIPHSRSSEATRWLREESAAQARRYRAIVAQQEALGPKRNGWVAGFLARIQKRGFHVHADQMRKIPAGEIPSPPKRKFRVVF